MAGKLAFTVSVDDQWYLAGDEDLPEDVAAKIGEHAFEGEIHPYPDARAKFVADRDGIEFPEPETPAGPTPPPMGGPGSGADAWALYAAEVDVDLEDVDTTKRDAIVEAIKAAGKPVDKTAE